MLLPAHSQRLLDRQLSFRDAALKEDPEFSGMPPQFEQWCRTTWLPSNIGRTYYRPSHQDSKRRLKTVLVAFLTNVTI